LYGDLVSARASPHESPHACGLAMQHARHTHSQLSRPLRATTPEESLSNLPTTTISNLHTIAS
jgi:hypothetical protein